MGIRTEEVCSIAEEGLFQFFHIGHEANQLSQDGAHQTGVWMLLSFHFKLVILVHKYF